MFTSPPLLSEGDTVLIIATARARDLTSIQPAIDALRSWGLNVELGKNALKIHHQFAGTDEERAADLQWALDHDNAKAILISGGGYGSLRIIDRIDFSRFVKNPKWIVGYSDTTVIHNRLMKLKIVAIHGTMAFQFSKDVHSTLSVKNLLFGNPVSYEIPVHHLNRSGNVSAEVVGGNLSLLYALSGSADDLSTKNKILFIEDLDEQLYHVDRMMMQLKRSGKLNDLAGLLVGGMSEMKDNAVPFGKTAEEIIFEKVRDFNFPVCFNFPAGHIQQNMAIYLGLKAELKASSKKVTLTYDK